MLFGLIKSKKIEAKPDDSKRSSKWPAVRKKHLEEHPTCAACGNDKIHELQVHHVKMFNKHPDLELCPENLITVCEASGAKICHLYLAHLGSWKRCNPNIREMAAEYLKLVGEAEKEKL